MSETKEIFTHDKKLVYILHVVPIMKFDFWKMPMLKNLLCTPQLNPVPVSLCWFNELQYIIFFTVDE